MALNRTQIIDVVMSRLGNRNDDTTLIAAAKTELDLVQSELEAEPFLPWFLISSGTNLTIVEGSANVALPTDFLREYEDEDVAFYLAATSEYTVLDKIDVDDLKKWQGIVATGRPAAYALVGSNFVIRPLPDTDTATGVLSFRYFQRGAALSDDVLTNVWTLNADWILVHRLGEIMARQYTRDIPLADGFKVSGQIAFAKLQAAHVAREQANRKAQMGGSDR